MLLIRRRLLPALLAGVLAVSAAACQSAPDPTIAVHMSRDFHDDHVARITVVPFLNQSLSGGSAVSDALHDAGYGSTADTRRSPARHVIGAPREALLAHRRARPDRSNGASFARANCGVCAN